MEMQAEAERKNRAQILVSKEEVRKLCCVVVTNGKEGCEVCWRDGNVKVLPFLANRIDPTGAGDSFLGGFVAALLGNFFGSATVDQIGLLNFDLRMLQGLRGLYAGFSPAFIGQHFLGVYIYCCKLGSLHAEKKCTGYVFCSTGQS